MDHSPAWNMLIAPSGSMKTVLLNTLSGLPSIHTLDEVTENTFISGMLDKSRTGKKTKTDQMPASLLNRIGDEGILIVPDFSTILAMNKNKQPVILSQLRRIYDGSFAREFGTAENLADRKWQGRITLLAGVPTPRKPQNHDGGLRSGTHTGQAHCSNQGRADDASPARSANGSGGLDP